MKCWQCGVHESDPICGACGIIQPPDPRLDHFERLGLTRRFAQDTGEVAASHRRLQRTVHPDRFASKGARERRLSLEHATALNDAVRTLRNPLLRADYLLLLRGVDVAAEGEDRVTLEPMFLMEILELREALDELTGPDAHPERAKLRHDIIARYEGSLAALGAGLDADEALPALVQSAAQLRYLRRVIEELETLDL
jgi:molecular chaperone HscB